MSEKAEGAFKTIGELSKDLKVPQHILRYWETRFSQLKPLTRAGNRRYYRSADVALVHRIHDLLYNQGYTVKGVQKLLSGKCAENEVQPVTPNIPEAHGIMVTPTMGSSLVPSAASQELIQGLKAVRARLAAALAA
jgi:DNA-binding transcriptional MerR regulator